MIFGVPKRALKLVNSMTTQDVNYNYAFIGWDLLTSHALLSSHLATPFHRCQHSSALTRTKSSHPGIKARWPSVPAPQTRLLRARGGGNMLPTATHGGGHIKRPKSDNGRRINVLKPINLQSCNGRMRNHSRWISALRELRWGRMAKGRIAQGVQ